MSVLPRIPKIKRENSNDHSQCSSNTGNGGRGDGSSPNTSSNGYSVPETCINSLAQDKSQQPSVDHQKGTGSGLSQRHQPDGAGSSSAFSSSFSSSSSTSYPASQPRYSSSSSAVSFRINSSGNTWHSRRSIPSSSSSGCRTQEHWRKKEEEARKRQFHKDKEMLLASCTMMNKEQDSNNIYDPFNPTLSDSSSSDDEAESSSLGSGSQHATQKENKDALVQSKLDLIRVKIETQAMEISPEEPTRYNTQETISQQVRCREEYVKTEKESRLVDKKVEKQTKANKGLDDVGEGGKVFNSVTVKKEEDTLEEESGQNVGTPNTASPTCRNASSASSSAPTNKKQKSETKSESSGALGVTTKKERHSSSSETDRGRRGDQHASDQGARQKEKARNKETSFRRSSSRERRRARSTSESSESSPPDRTRRKRQASQSPSKHRKRSR